MLTHRLTRQKQLSLNQRMMVSLVNLESVLVEEGIEVNKSQNSKWRRHFKLVLMKKMKTLQNQRERKKDNPKNRDSTKVLIMMELGRKI